MDKTLVCGTRDGSSRFEACSKRFTEAIYGVNREVRLLRGLSPRGVTVLGYRDEKIPSKQVRLVR